MERASAADPIATISQEILGYLNFSSGAPIRDSSNT